MPASPRPSSADDLASTSNKQELRLPGLLAGATAVVAFFAMLALALHAVGPHIAAHGPNYNAWLARVSAAEPLARVQWALGDMTEPQFYKSWIASLGLLAGAAIAWWAGSRRRKWAGMPICFGSGLWPWILGSSTLSLALSNLVFGWALADGWQPTFVPFVCVATSLVLVYGRGWPVLFTGAVMGAFTTTPVAMLLIAYVTGPLKLPGVVANTAAMSFGAVVTFAVSRYLPWMPAPKDNKADPATKTTIDGRPTTGKDAIWIVRRILADFTETQFYANELASIGVIVGVTVAVLLNPLFPAYGTGLLPHILFAQALTSAIGVVVWRRLYRGGGWAPTYISVVSVAPATVLTFNGSAVSIAVGAVAGALLCPVVARPISKRLPADFHPFIGNTTSMAVCTALVIAVLRLI